MMNSQPAVILGGLICDVLYLGVKNAARCIARRGICVQKLGDCLLSLIQRALLCMHHKLAGLSLRSNVVWFCLLAEMQSNIQQNPKDAKLYSYVSRTAHDPGC